MTLQDAKNCKFVKMQGFSSDQTFLALYLLEEKFKKEESFFYPYITLLPNDYHFMPLYFNEKTVQELKGSHCESMLISQRLSLEEDYNKLCQELKSEFSNLAKSHDRNAAQLLRDIEFVQLLIVQGIGQHSLLVQVTAARIVLLAQRAATLDQFLLITQ